MHSVRCEVSECTCHTAQKMANCEELEIFGDVIEEPPMLICGEGAGAECDVGNEEKSSNNFFFFGQPGCLKHSPIKTFSSESITGLSSFKSSTSSDDVKATDDSTKCSNNDANSGEASHKNDNDVEDKNRESAMEIEDESNKSSNENDLKSEHEI